MLYLRGGYMQVPQPYLVYDLDFLPSAVWQPDCTLGWWGYPPGLYLRNQNFSPQRTVLEAGMAFTARLPTACSGENCRYHQPPP